MNSLKRQKQANKTKDTIIMTKYNIVKIFQRRLPPEKSGISMADGTASRANASGVAAGLHSTARVNISIPIL